MRLRLFFLFCLIYPFLTGWGHWGPNVKVGLSLGQSQGREILVHKLKEELEESRAELVLSDAKGDPAVQEKQVQDMISKGIQSLMVIPADPSKARPLVEIAHKAGIKVLSLERLIPDSGLDYLVAFNSEKEGELQARALISRVPRGRYVLSGDSKGGMGNLREGWMKLLKPLVDRGDIQIVASLTATGAGAPKNMEAVVKKKADAVLTSNQESAQEASQALEKAGLSGKVQVGGLGEDLATCQRIISGAQFMTVYHPPQKLAEEAAYLAAKLARKAKEFDCQFTEIKNGESKTLAVLLTPLVVDAKNLDSTVIKDGVQKKDEVYGK